MKEEAAATAKDSRTVPKEMLINVSHGEECRIAVLEDGRLAEIYMERDSNASHVGNIYKGKVTNVEAAIQAAFVDFGLPRNGFLHISDLLPTYFGGKADDYQESVGRKLGRRDRPPIQRCLRRGDEVLVQIIKEGIGTKGPTLTTYLSIPGRILVMMPGMENFGVSRKIEDEVERRRLRKILDELNPVEGVGFIVRTAGMGKGKAEIEKDLKYLTEIWNQIQDISHEHGAPVELYTEGDLITRTVRDIYGADVDRIVIDDADAADRIRDFVKPNPRARTKVEFYAEPTPMFHAYGIERELELLNVRHVPLPSGGSLVIDSTEAVVAIDVNSGKSRDFGDAETTAFRTDLEAADEIPRQLKLRDLGGVIICDFIDLRFDRHRRELEERLYQNFQKDKAKTRVLRMSEFGIIEITRQRQRASLKRSLYSDCPHCKGAGLIKSPESVSIDVMRKLGMAAQDARVSRIQVAVAPDVASFLGNHRRRQLADLEVSSARSIEILADPAVGADASVFTLLDDRDGRVNIDALAVSDRSEPSPGGRRGGRGRSRGGRGAAGPDAGRGRPDRAPDDRADRADPRRPRPDEEARRRDETQRAFDRVKPVGLEQARAGDGHRGPKVVPIEPEELDHDRDEHRGHDEQEGREAAYDEHDGAAAPADPRRPQSGQPPAPGDAAQAPDLDPEEAARRRRRRRRGGRGRRRGNRGEEFASPVAPGAPLDADAAAPALDDESMEDDRPPEPSSSEASASAFGMGAAPAAIGDDTDLNAARAAYFADEGDDDAVDTDRDEDANDRRREDAADLGDDFRSEPPPSRADAEDPADAEEPEAAAEEPPPRRSARGSRTRRGAATSRAPEPAPTPAEEPDEAEKPKRSKAAPRGKRPATPEKKSARPAAAPPTPRRTPPATPSSSARSQPSIPPVVQIVKTGSADKHLADDEPVDPQPARRPRSRRDLDEIPDDFD